MTEFGLFSDEGCVEAGMWSRAEAEEALATLYDADDREGIAVAPICSEHAEQTADECEECAAELADDEDEDDEP